MKIAGKILRPEGYRKQSELLDWLPGAEAINDNYGVLFIEQLRKSSSKRQNRIFIDVISGLFFGGLAFGLIWNLNGFEVEETKSSVIITVILIAVFLGLTLYFAWNFVQNGLWGTEEPDLDLSYEGPLKESFSEIIDYWKAFQKSDYQIFAEAGKNGLGINLEYKNSEYGILSLIGNHTQRGGIFTPLVKRISQEWWFPSPELLKTIEVERPKQGRAFILETIISYPDDKEANDLLVRLSSLAGRETKKSRVARCRWIEIIRATRELRTVTDTDERENQVRQKLTESLIALEPKSPVREISRYFTFRPAEQAFKKYLAEPHVQKNKLAQELLTQLTQSS